MYEGKLVNLLEASLIGYELIYVDKKKKLTKIYSEEESNTYNVSIALDSTNKINELQILQIVWGKENEAEIRDNLQKSFDLDIKKITKI